MVLCSGIVTSDDNIDEKLKVVEKAFKYVSIKVNDHQDAINLLKCIVSWGSSSMDPIGFKISSMNRMIALMILCYLVTSIVMLRSTLQ